MGKLTDELNRMEKLNIIEKVSHPTDWVNNIVIVEKLNGSVRVCLDPMQLDKDIRHYYYQLPTPEDSSNALYPYPVALDQDKL